MKYDSPVYVEKHKGKLKLYQITQMGGSFTRLERNSDGSATSVRYAFGTGRSQVLLTPDGARALSHLGLQEVHAPSKAAAAAPVEEETEGEGDETKDEGDDTPARGRGRRRR